MTLNGVIALILRYPVFLALLNSCIYRRFYVAELQVTTTVVYCLHSMSSLSD